MSEHCPTCATDLSKDRTVKPTHTLQEWFDSIASEEFKMPLKTIQEACAAHGWLFTDKPICCGKEINVKSFLGGAYHGECETCHKWVHDVSVQFGNSWVQFPPETVDDNTPKRWIHGAGAR